MATSKLYMLLLGATPPGRYTEQHDIFFGIAENLKDLLPQIHEFWPEAGQKIHVDAWRQVNRVDQYQIEIINKEEISQPEKLFFINLGGYKQNEFDEFHYKMLTIASEKSKAIQQAKQTVFYKHTGFEGAPSHVDDKYGIDVDDLYEIEEVLHADFKNRFSIKINPASESLPDDHFHLGYYNLKRIAEMNEEAD